MFIFKTFAHTENMVILMIGGSSGIGLATAKLLQKYGNKVINASRTSAQTEGIEDFSLDIVNFERIESVVSDVLQKYKRIDVLINCAGFSMAAPIEEVKEEDYRYLFDVNFFGALKAMQTVIPVMKKQHFGRIVNISSVAAVLPIPYDGYYSASKAALNVMSKALAMELKDTGITLTALMPGGTKTNFTFKRKIYTDIDNGNRPTEVKNSAEILRAVEQDGMSAESVAKIIAKVIRKKHPPLLISTGGKNKFFHALSRILPDKMTNWFLCKKYKI